MIATVKGSQAAPPRRLIVLLRTAGSISYFIPCRTRRCPGRTRCGSRRVHDQEGRPSFQTRWAPVSARAEICLSASDAQARSVTITPKRDREAGRKCAGAASRATTAARIRQCSAPVAHEQRQASGRAQVIPVATRWTEQHPRGSKAAGP
jgi:hypothetical protein